MALSFVKLTTDEITEAFKQRSSGTKADNVQPIVDELKAAGITVGDGFKLHVQDELVDGITVRATKRRYGAAAKILGFNLKWKPLGHKERALIEKDGKQFEEDVFFTDWLVVRVDSSQVTTNGEGKKRGRPKKQAEAVAA